MNVTVQRMYVTYTITDQGKVNQRKNRAEENKGEDWPREESCGGFNEPVEQHRSQHPVGSSGQQQRWHDEHQDHLLKYIDAEGAILGQHVERTNQGHGQREESNRVGGYLSDGGQPVKTPRRTEVAGDKNRQGEDRGR